MERGAALGVAVEKWQRAGLWGMTRPELDYPRRFKQAYTITPLRFFLDAATATCSIQAA
ncbi:MAG TPA: hypothetical protein VKB53_09820 [Gammaproteobacteria bacterium]|nr:hypothetical protein [Gammaproteobacteria bacterium]HKH21157.1 hypothetical protein [Gammaproteobacteria bacterium]